MKTRRVLSELEPYVAGKRIEGGIKLSSNENPLGPSPKAMQAIPGIVDDIHRYPDGGMHVLRSRLAERWGVTEEMTIVGNGSDEIMVMIAGALIEPGTNTVTGAHTFSQYTFATRIFGGEVRITPMRDGRFDLDAIEQRIDEQTRAVFLCSPNNPTGTIVRRETLERFLDRVPADVVIVVDEAYAEFAEDANYPDTISLVARHPNLIRLRTFSKIYGLAALRVGYGIAQPELIAAVSRLRQPFNVGTVAQTAASAALDDTAFVERSLENNRREKARLYRFLDGAAIPYYPTEANFVCADLSGIRAPSGGAAAVVEGLTEQRITIRPLTSFGLPDHVRISIGTAAQMDAFYEAFRRLG